MNIEALRAREAALQSELDRRATPSQRQARAAITNDRREVEIDDRDDDELTASEKQARSLLNRGRREGWSAS